MKTSSSSKALEIAELVDRLKGHFVLSTAGLPVVLHEKREDLLRAVGVLPTDSIQMGLGKGNGLYCIGPINQYLDGVQHDHDTKLSVMRSWAELATLRIGQEMKNVEYFDRRPLFEYLRHLRNAVAHGNTFNIIGPVAHTARFRDHSIDRSQHGKTAIGGELKVGEVFLLLDDIALSLRTLTKS